MTITTEATDRPELRPTAFDLYRDIHKGIRAELFSVTDEAGRIDASEDSARQALAAHVHDVMNLLVSHAEHEDTHVQPAIERHLPKLAATIASDHISLEQRIEGLRELAGSAVGAGPSEQRFAVHRAYVELAAFTAAYLEHQDTEERLVMPALADAIGLDRVLAINEAIVSSIPPEEMMPSLAIMLPAMNVDDREELLSGMRAGAPPEAFQAAWSLARSVLDAADGSALGARLQLP